MVSFEIKYLTLSTTPKESYERENYLQSASLDMYMWGTDLCAALLRSEDTPPSSRCPGPASGRGSLGPPPAARPLYPRPAARERPPRHRRLIGQWVLTCFAKENTPFINKSSESVQHISKSSVFFKIWFRYHCLFQTKNIFQNSIDILLCSFRKFALKVLVQTVDILLLFSISDVSTQIFVRIFEGQKPMLQRGLSKSTQLCGFCST